MNAWQSAVPKTLRLISPLLLTMVLLEPARAQLGMTNPVSAPDEPCYLKISDPNSTSGQLFLPDAYRLPPPEFLVNPLVNRDAYFNITTSDSLQTNSLHPFLRYYAQVAAGKFMGKVPQVLPSQVLVDAVKIYLGVLPLGTTLAGAPLDARTWASKVAQLAVTGRLAYNSFRLWHPQDADLIQLVQRANPTINQTDLQNAVKFVLDASYSAAWAIRSNEPMWRSQRAQMGWIAVSGEDDTPHRPVNVPTAPYPQYDLLVSVGVPFGTVKAVTRYMVASYNTFIGPDTPPAGFPALPQPNSGTSGGGKSQSSGITLGPRASVRIPTSGIRLSNTISLPRQLPIDDLPVIPPGNKIIIYIHGGGSRLEEAVPMANNLILEGMRPGPQGGIGNQDYTVISLDLPNSGYGSSFDPSCVYGNCNPLPLNQYHPVPDYPILMFEKQYVLNFIDALDVAVGNVKNRIVAFMGGSLGGNLSLILGGLYTGGNPYLKTVVAWSPTAMLKTDGLSNLVVSSSWIGNLNTTNWGLEDGAHTRTDYFNKLYFQPISPQLGIPADPEMWFRADWPGYGTTTGAGNGAVTVNLDCAKSNVTQSRFDRYEIYSQEVRRWTTAIDLEQAMYDFRNPGPDGRPHYLAIPARVLLATGQSDNYSNRPPNPGGVLEGAGAGLAAGALAGLAFGGPIGGGVFGIVGGVLGVVYGSGVPTLNNVDIYGYTHDVANLMANTPGRTLFIQDTGHSIHNERPQFFAQEIVDFLKTHDTTLQVNVGAGGSGLRWNSQVFAILSTKSNQGGLTVDLNAMWHPWNPNPPAINNPCGLCKRLDHFELRPNSQNSFYIGLSRTGINLGDIGGLGIQFFGGSRGPTDTPDHLDLTIVGLNAWGLNGMIGPLGMGTMLNATGSSSAPAGQPLKTLQSPFDLWQTTNITAPQPPLPAFAVRLHSGTDASGPYVSIGNGPSQPQYWTQVPTWIQVNAVDGSNNPVQADVTVDPIAPRSWDGIQTQPLEAAAFAVLPGEYLPSSLQQTGIKFYYMCLPGRDPISLPNGQPYPLGSFSASTGRPPNLRPFPGNQQGCSLQVSAPGYVTCYLQLGQAPSSGGPLGALGGLFGGVGGATLPGQPCPSAPTTGGGFASVQNNTTAGGLKAGTTGLQVQLPALAATVCPSVDGKTCISNTAPPQNAGDIVTVTSGGAPVGGATVSVSVQSIGTASVGSGGVFATDANGLASIPHYRGPCYAPGSQVPKVGQTTVPNRTQVPCPAQTATVVKQGYQSAVIGLP
jgi:pimeloyl-ACP methyl ester carboxylesterase